jgi:hypothetical protein
MLKTRYAKAIDKLETLPSSFNLENDDNPDSLDFENLYTPKDKLTTLYAKALDNLETTKLFHRLLI